MLVTFAICGVSVAATPVMLRPQPFYSDETFLTVTFTAPAATVGGRRYYALWQSDVNPNVSDPGCSPISDTGVVGRLARKGQKITFRLHYDTTFGSFYCPGPSHVQVFTQLSGRQGQVAPEATRKTLHPVAIVRFRVYRA